MVSGYPAVKSRKKKKFRTSFESDDDSDLFAGISPARKNKIYTLLLEEIRVKYETELTEKLTKKIKQDFLKKEREEKVNIEDVKSAISYFKEVELEANAQSVIIHDEINALKNESFTKFIVSFLLILGLVTAVTAYFYVPLMALSVLLSVIFGFSLVNKSDAKQFRLNRYKFLASEAITLAVQCKYLYTTEIKFVKNYKQLFKYIDFAKEGHYSLNKEHASDPIKIENARILCETKLSAVDVDDDFIARLQLREAEKEAEDAEIDMEEVNVMKRIKS